MFNAEEDKKEIGGASSISAGATGADIAASTFGCAVGVCPGVKVTDSVLMSNTAPLRLVAKASVITSVGIEAYEFNAARENGNALGMAGATVDLAAMIPAFIAGVPGIVFSTSYAITDNLLNPIIVPKVVDLLCWGSGNCR